MKWSLQWTKENQNKASLTKFSVGSVYHTWVSTNLAYYFRLPLLAVRRMDMAYVTSNLLFSQNERDW